MPNSAAPTTRGDRSRPAWATGSAARAAAGRRRLAKAKPTDDTGKRSHHDEREAGVPVAEYVEEAEHLCRVHHLRDEQSEAEHEARRRDWRRSAAWLSLQRRDATRQPPSTAVAMNTPVATSDRGERRATPQTPCPLVQPLPSRVPKPTSRPAPTMRPPAAPRQPLRRRHGKAAAYGRQRREDQSGDEGEPPALPVVRSGEPACEDAADAGDAAGEQPRAAPRRDRSARRQWPPRWG